tara:strand:+ start:139 stop:516 length:378 start_codon:yes stop_codon:yes gene_type:complete
MNDANEKIIYGLTREDLSHLIAGAFEGGSNYWYDSVEVASLPEGTTRADFPYLVDIPVQDGGSLTFTEQETGSRFAVDLMAIKMGLNFLAANSTHVFARIITQNWDAGDADCLLQAAVFGEVVYG